MIPKSLICLANMWFPYVHIQSRDQAARERLEVLRTGVIA